MMMIRLLMLQTVTFALLGSQRMEQFCCHSLVRQLQCRGGRRWRKKNYNQPVVVTFAARSSSSSKSKPQQQQTNTNPDVAEQSSSSLSSSPTSCWMNEGLLFSSFSDGVVPNKRAQHYLCRGLVRALLRQELRVAEASLRSSVRASPCNGPNIQALQRLEQLDGALDKLKNDDETSKDPVQLLLQTATDWPMTLRFVYIPTAMYALRRASTNTPGKQRQRARADGKKRRDEIVALLHQLLLSTHNTKGKQDERSCHNINIATVTLDLDDGSLKQAKVTTATATTDASIVAVDDDSAAAASVFPKSGQEALRDWCPHLVYVQGGNTFWLYHCLMENDDTNWKDDLRILLCSGNTFYCGSSAGAIVAGSSMEPAGWKGWDDPSIVPGGRQTYDDWNGVASLKLVGNAAFFPHYDEDQWAAVVQGKMAALAPRRGGDDDDDDSNTNIQVCCLQDDQVCYVDGSAKKTVIA